MPKDLQESELTGYFSNLRKARFGARKDEFIFFRTGQPPLSDQKQTTGHQIDDFTMYAIHTKLSVVIYRTLTCVQFISQTGFQMSLLCGL